MADETPEPDPFDEPSVRSRADAALPIDADLATRAAMQDDRSAFVPVAHPWFAPTARLVDWATPEAIDAADRPPMGWRGWCLVVFGPAALLWLAQGLLAGLGWLGALAVLALHVWVLWHGVLAGRLHRRLDRLFLFAARAEHIEDTRDTDACGSARDWILRWVGRSEACSAVLLVAFRDVFAPLLCYLVLPGATGARDGAPRVTCRCWMPYRELRTALLVLACCTDRLVRCWCGAARAARLGGVAASSSQILNCVPTQVPSCGFALSGHSAAALFGQ